MIAVRDTDESKSAWVIAHELRYEYKDDDVMVIVIPNIESVNYGRGVGYEIIEHIPTNEMAAISGTALRDS